ncbi:RHS repeat-associated core domain-containing protein [uncultured Shewanella sp.]|uniref:RHS repeat-associated core domain-containing protein n=1 Tax=uncultured Shewanella sp. TaxID=173975 RepID=UPI0026138CEE|nr:RHS repeat-associated core domain-containing protein [uncultured Shewanella sp.]
MQLTQSACFLSILTCLSSLFFNVSASQTVPLSGQFKVSQQGAATYTLPIEVPTARGGLKPDVSLMYSSSNGDGYLGQGWSLAASSVISRCPQSFSQDGLLKGVDLSMDDKFCLGGQRLVLVSGRYGEADSQYKKEIDDASLVTALGQASGGGPEGFKLETKSGETHYFGDISAQSNKRFNDIDGNDEDGDAAIKMETDGGQVTRLWALKAIEDTLGNYIAYHYLKTDTEQVLSSIDYGGHSDGETPYIQVKFHYMTNSKPKSGYVYGQAFRLSRLLSRIEITLDAQHQRSYFLDYSTSTTLEDKNYIYSIQACVDSNKLDCTAPISFNWTRPSLNSSSFAPFSASSVLSMPKGEALTSQTFDMDGDGLADIIYVRDGAWYKRTLSTGAEMRLTGFGSSQSQFAQSIDYDGDGQRDLLIASDESSNWKVISFKPSTLTTPSCEPNGGGARLCEDIKRQIAYTLTDLNRKALGFKGSALVADVNGDALEDIVFLKDKQLQWYQNQGGVFDVAKTLYTFGNQETGIFEPKVILSAPSFKTSAAVDVNGDGLTDLLLKVKSVVEYCSAGRGRVHDVSRGECVGDLQGQWRSSETTAWRLYVSNGSRFIARQTMTGTDRVERLRVADFNGDGLTDIAYVRDGTWRQRVSDGKLFLRESELGEESVGINANEPLDNSTFFLDLNGDGRSDMLRPSVGDMHVFISKPSAKADIVDWEERGKFPLLGGSDSSIRFADTLGDGRVDIYYVQNNQWRLSKSTTPLFNNTINKITDGFGVETSITYKHITDDGAEGVYKTQVSGNVDPTKNFSTIPALQVVQRVQTATGDNSSVGVKYEYGGLLVNRLGRGFQGFELLRTIDEQSNVTTETQYAQLFPRTGLPLATKQHYNNVALSESVNSYTFAEVDTQETAKIFRRTQMNITETSRQYGSDDIVRDLVKTLTQHEYDAWSNLTRSTVEKNDITAFTSSSKVVTTNVYAGAGGGAEKGRLSHTTVESFRFGSGGSPSITQSSAFSYYNNGLLKKSTLSPDDNRYKLVTTKQYDKYGNTTQVDITGGRNALGNELQTRTSRTVYGSRGRFVHSTTNSAGDMTISQYNQQSASEVTGRITSATVIDPNGRKVTKYFDYWGRVVKEMTPDFIPVFYRYELCSDVDCTPFSKGYLLTSKIKIGAPAEQLISDKYGRDIGRKVKGFNGQWVVTAKTYDDKGRVARQYESHYASISQYYSEVLYDNFNRVVGERMPNGSTNTRYYQGLETLFTDSNGKQKNKVINAFGEQVKVTDELYNELTFDYDAKGNLLESYVQSSGGKKVLRAALKYDNYGRKVKNTDLDKGVWLYSYNAFGELLSQTNASGQITHLTYDVTGRKVRRVDDEGTSCWLYGNKGGNTAGMLVAERVYDNVVNDCQANGYQQQKRFEYDAKGRLALATTNIDNAAYSTGFTYDAAGRIKTLRYPNNLLTVENVYNDVGYLRQRKNQGTSTAYQTIIAMNARGQITQVNYGNGAQESMSYQPNTGWVDNIKLEKDGVLHNLTYTFDDVGNLSGREHQLSTAPAVFAEHYDYDDLYRLYDRTITLQSGGSTLPVDFKNTLSTRFDDLGNITSKSGVGRYQYDNENPYRLLDICNDSQCNQKETQAATKECPVGYELNVAQTACEKKEKRKATTSHYFTCPTGFSLTGNSCSKGESKAAQVIDSCPSGWTRSGTSCARTLAQNAAGEKVYSCPAGYTRSGTRCSKFEVQKATKTYQCGSGWTLSGTACNRILSQSATPKHYYACSTGYSLVGTSCHKINTVTAGKLFYCASGWALSGSSCRQTKTASSQTVYSCPSGYSRSGSTCRLTQTKSATAKTVAASCPAGFHWNALSGKCRKRVTVNTTRKPTNLKCFGGEPMGRGRRLWECWDERSVGSNTQYSCSVGWSVSGSQCTKTLTQTATSKIRKYCPMTSHRGEPEYWRLSGNTCTNMDSTKSASYNYTCPAGYSRSGSNCSKLLTQHSVKTTTYSCPAGYTRSGATCRKAENKGATRIYNCPTGWGHQGDSCTRVLAQNTSSKTVYSCPSAWSLSGTSCLKNESKTATRSYQCEGGWSKSGTQCNRTLTQTAKTNTRFHCPSGWTAVGELCSNTLVTALKYSCPANWTLEGSQCSRIRAPRYKMQYDARGNIINDGNRCFSYTSSDLVSAITQGDESSRFNYDANRARFKRSDIKIEQGVNAHYTTYYVGSHYEKVIRTGGGKASLTEQKLYVGNAVITIRSNSSSDTYYLHKDHQGSTTTITNASGNVVQQLIYDPWGKQTAAFTHSLLGHYASPAERKGYTGHESISHLDIIHMNGRIYDATIGRFLQADPFVQQADNLQNYNRYAYVMNTPMSYTDPSGFFFDKIWKEIKPFIGVIIAAVASYFCAGTCGPAIWAAIGGASGAISAAVNGGNIFRGALIGAVTAGVAAGLADSSVLETFLANGFVGGVASEVSGGNFGHGFIAAGASGLAGGAIGKIDNSVGRIVVRGVIGGTISEVTGGKFANGAKSAAFAQLAGELTQKGRPPTPSEVTDARIARGMYIKGFKGADNYLISGGMIDGDDGLTYALFVNQETGHSILAFRGTDGEGDWGNNASQALYGESAQYDQAKGLARTFYKNTGGNIRFVGHSLGGGLASAAALVTGGNATVFNAAGLNPNTVNGSGSVVYFYSTVDALRYVNMITPVNVPGEHVSLGIAGGHGMDAVCDAMGC